MKREFRIGFKICLIVMALESVFWLIWLIFRPLPVLPQPIHAMYVSIWLSDMVVMPLFYIPAICIWHINEKCGMSGVKWLALVAGLVGAFGAFYYGYGLGGALLTYVLLTVLTSTMVFVILLTYFIGDMFLESRPIKRLSDWMLR